MRIAIAAVTPRKQRLKATPANELLRHYVEGCNRYSPTEAIFFETEAALLENIARAGGRTPSHIVLLDSRGKGLDSKGIAECVRRIRDAGTQQMVFAVGPANGWSEAARGRAGLLLSLGNITLPHELALVVLAEQIYRAQTILAGHPYHSGHE
jgi:23S rRNA (pseudouridine1915-N3)-methyltransferase